MPSDLSDGSLLMTIVIGHWGTTIPPGCWDTAELSGTHAWRAPLARIQKSELEALVAKCRKDTAVSRETRWQRWLSGTVGTVEQSDRKG